MENVNMLDFEMFDPVEAGEDWAVNWGSNHKVVEILVNGQKLLDIIRNIELPYAEEEGRIAKAEGYDDGYDYSRLAGAYGHLSPKDLYVDLSTVPDGESAEKDNRVHLYCCRDCGDILCWSVTMKVREENGYVYWYDFFQPHRGWKYDLTFKFDKDDYEEALWKLWDLAKKEKRGKGLK